ncbi:MAG: glycosyltransferase family 2 protein [Eggerthellaceae bacterium]|nr:glycosyltransferase family 2 protein [Eggerthellaceae bacterium]
MTALSDNRTSAGTPVISVVVPACNVAPYLSECLESIRVQTFTGFECIVVDDGSTDDSAAIAQSFCDADPRFSLTRQAYGGVSRARNTGIVSSRGCYLAFVDSDDVCHPELLERLLEAIRRTGAPLAVTGLQHFEDGLKGRTYRDPFAPPADSPETVDERGFWEMRHANPSQVGNHVHTKLFCRCLFDDLRFREGMFFEDVEILTRMMPRLDRIAVVPGILYDYRVHPTSILETLDAAGRLDGIEAYTLRGEHLERCGWPDLVRANAPFILRHASEYARLEPGASPEVKERAKGILARAKRFCGIAARVSDGDRGLTVRLAVMAASWRLYAASARYARKRRPGAPSR